MSAPSLGIAVIGASGHAARVAAPTIRFVDGAHLTGVLGSSAESGARLAAEYDGARGFADWEELALDDATEAVWIAGPNYLHAEFAERALAAGKHVLVEKPVATRGAEAERIAELAADRGLVAVVDFQHRFRAGHLWLRDRLREGAVGTPHLIRIHRFWPYPYFPDMPVDIGGSWRTSVDGSGGWALNDIGSHLVDLALWLAGGGGHLVHARTANHRFVEVAAEDTAVLVIALDDGGTVIVETSNAMSSFPGTIEVHGSGGWFRADGTFDDHAVIVSHTGERHEFVSGFEEVYRASLADFAARVHGRGGAGATAAEAVVTTRIIEAAAEAHRSGRALSSTQNPS